MLPNPLQIINFVLVAYCILLISCECPRGFYQPEGTSRIEVCEPCPRGHFGATKDLNTAFCSGKCPIGTYNDRLGAISDEDCQLCPPGTWGNTKGLTTRKCSGACPFGTYSSVWGLNSSTGCLTCPTGYKGWQCAHRQRF
mmetsp:Transcript_33776/g.34413  ORF Transcript_33776/g.34413 Transcript_33776/m.34413 type:complete len:140 (-) Transcript_33776:182-601(-)